MMDSGCTKVTVMASFQLAILLIVPLFLTYSCKLYIRIMDYVDVVNVMLSIHTIKS